MCPDNCSRRVNGSICHRYNGTCYGCDEGSWGDLCDKQCNCSICDKKTGACPPQPNKVQEWFKKYWYVPFIIGTSIIIIILILGDCFHKCCPTKCPSMRIVNLAPILIMIV